MGDVPAAGRSRQASSIDEILDLYRRWGTQHYDEALSQTSHALQTAACARAEGAADELVAAALLHDVGHLLVMDATGSGDVDPEVDTGHEGSGARYLAGLFPAAVTAPIALHVLAKRYRCTVDPTEVDRLSAGSRASLVRQGGPLSADEAARFARQPAAAAALRLRTWDDAGKDLGAEPGALEDHRDLLRRVAGLSPG
jgi:predicted HD phosphohydrolase